MNSQTPAQNNTNQSSNGLPPLPGSSPQPISPNSAVPNSEPIQQVNKTENISNQSLPPLANNSVPPQAENMNNVAPIGANNELAPLPSNNGAQTSSTPEVKVMSNNQSLPNIAPVTNAPLNAAPSAPAIQNTGSSKGITTVLSMLTILGIVILIVYIAVLLIPGLRDPLCEQFAGNSTAEDILSCSI